MERGREGERGEGGRGREREREGEREMGSAGGRERERGEGGRERENISGRTLPSAEKAEDKQRNLEAESETGPHNERAIVDIAHTQTDDGRYNISCN